MDAEKPAPLERLSVELEVAPIDIGPIDAATAALKRLADAASRAGAELDKLAGKQFGALTIAIAGDVAHVTVAPEADAA